MSACPTCGAELPADAPEALCPRCLLRFALETQPSPQPISFSPPSPRDLAPHFPQLEILGLIGQGGMGAVYKARQIKLDRLVALKILPQNERSDPAFAERFTREARALARLQHPNIVAVHDFGEAGDWFYLLMEYVEGTNLRQEMKSRRFSPERVVEIVSEVCDALQYAHNRDIVHRDIKPENVLIDRHGQVKLVDFGLAKLVGRDPTELTLTAIDQAMGTPHYIAPEQLQRAHEVDGRADIYSLGVVAYELLTGELPLGRFDPPSKRSSVNPALDAVVMKALERDPGNRFQSAADMKAALRNPSGERAIPAAAPAMPEAGHVESGLSSSTEALIIMGLVAGIAAIILGIVKAHTAWFALGLLAVEQIASAITWTPDRRAVIGTLLALGGVAVSAVIIIFVPGDWWICLLIWFWYGERVRHFFAGVTAKDFSTGFGKLFTEDWSDYSPDEQRILKAVHTADSEGIVKYPTDLDGEELAALRTGSEVLPEERVLAVVSLADDDSPNCALVFGSRHIYFPAVQNGESIRCSLSYDSLPARQIVNHGNGLYIGDGITLTPESEMNCEALVGFFNSVRRALEQSPQMK